MSTKKVIVLKSEDGEIFEVEEKVAMMLVSIKHAIDVSCASSTIPVPGVSAGVLSKVLEYCHKHIELSPHATDVSEDDSEIKRWEKEFIDDIDSDTLCKLAMAANFLDVKDLLETICEHIAAMIRGKSTEEMRKILNLPNDLTPEEQEAIRKDNSWAFN